MTANLEHAARKIDVPDVPGVSGPAIRRVLSSMARLAQIDGTFRYGLRGSKVAERVDASLSTVRRAQRWLVENGYLEKVEVGGGRKSTRWRIVVAKLLDLIPDPRPGHASGSAETAWPNRRDTALARTLVVPRLLKPWSRRGPTAPTLSPPVGEVCEEHGSRAGVMPDGITPRSPSCRRVVQRLREHYASPTRKEPQ